MSDAAKRQELERLAVADIVAAAEWIRDTRDIDGLDDQFEAALDNLVAALARFEATYART